MGVSGWEGYKHLNAEFQRIARRNKKAFLSDQCKEIEENNRMGKTRELFKKIRATKGTFHAKMGDNINTDKSVAIVVVLHVGFPGNQLGEMEFNIDDNFKKCW